MKQTRTSLRNRLALLVAFVAAFVVSFVWANPKAQAACDRATIRYYSDASHTTEVGKCTHGCCQTWTCTGQVTDYYTVKIIPCI